MNYTQDNSFMTIPLSTAQGVLTAVFCVDAVNCYKDVYTAWFKEKPSVIVQACSVTEAIEELHVSLKYMLDYEWQLKNSKK